MKLLILLLLLAGCANQEAQTIAVKKLCGNGCVVVPMATFMRLTENLEETCK